MDTIQYTNNIARFDMNENIMPSL